MGYTLLDGTICLGRCLCEALGVGKNEQGCGYLDEDVKHTHCCFALDLSVLYDSGLQDVMVLFKELWYFRPFNWSAGRYCSLSI